MRMTGCPNGCARSVHGGDRAGRASAPNKYSDLPGRERILGTRLNRLYKESVPVPAIATELRPLLQRFASERAGAERFGDFLPRRVLLAELDALNRPGHIRAPKEGGPMSPDQRFPNPPGGGGGGGGGVGGGGGHSRF